MPVEQHCLVLEMSKGLRKEVPNPACPIGDQEQGAERAHTQEQRHLQALKEWQARAPSLPATHPPEYGLADLREHRVAPVAQHQDLDGILTRPAPGAYPPHPSRGRRL